jgi:hypothetical protein
METIYKEVFYYDSMYISEVLEKVLDWLHRNESNCFVENLIVDDDKAIIYYTKQHSIKDSFNLKVVEKIPEKAWTYND